MLIPQPHPFSFDFFKLYLILLEALLGDSQRYLSIQMLGNSDLFFGLQVVQDSFQLVHEFSVVPYVDYCVTERELHFFSLVGVQLILSFGIKRARGHSEGEALLFGFAC